MIKFNVMLPSKIYKNENLGATEIVVYSFLHMLAITRQCLDKVYYSAPELTYYMYGDSSTKKETEMIRGAIKNLAEKKIIRIDEHFIYPEDFVLPENEYFALVPIDKLQIILQSDYKNRFEICLYLIWMLGTRNMATKVNSLTVSMLMAVTGKSRSTVLSYNNILVNLGIMCVDNAGAYMINGKPHGTRNKYALAEDAPKLKNPSVKRLSGNDKRSLSAKLTYINKHPESVCTKYTEEELQEIYDYCIKYNAQLKQYQENDPQYVGVYKDVSILENVLFF